MRYCLAIIRIVLGNGLSLATPQLLRLFPGVGSLILGLNALEGEAARGGGKKQLRCWQGSVAQRQAPRHGEAEDEKDMHRRP